jgi:hypothetical protein
MLGATEFFAMAARAVLMGESWKAATSPDATRRRRHTAWTAAERISTGGGKLE